ncbi:hypothetical protein [Streptomyces sp. NPDC005281]|uniref:hypothetical protein n=1 Tax=Streptomyces sp. NPDC005281 TaxID=3155712 RepID=UPI0033B2DBE0
MTSQLNTRVSVMTVMLPVCVVGSGACYGLFVDEWAGAVVGAVAAGVGVGFGMAARPRPLKGDGYAEGLADSVLVTIALYEAAVFPLTSAGSSEEQAARRALAYRVAASDGLPRSVRVAAAAALEALDDGLDAERAQAALKDLILAVYRFRASHEFADHVTVPRVLQPWLAISLVAGGVVAALCACLVGSPPE